MLRKAVISLFLLLACLVPLRAQSQSAPVASDSVISLLNAEWAKLTQVNYRDFRLVKGPAVFFHNGAYLFCDSAAWDIKAEIIKAYRNVRITQDKTVLRSDSLTYFISENLAQFRGPLVDVFDNEGDTLRTNNLDYNTKDSIAVFRNGGAMKDKDGNIIEGRNGTYSSSSKVFTFEDDVQLFTDSIFIKSSKMDYVTEENKAYFRDRTYLWREDAFMKALAGWYDTENDVVNFNKEVYMNTPDYEMWAGDLNYYRTDNRVEAYDNVEMLDTLRETAFVAHKAIVSIDSLNNDHMVFTNQPSIIYYGENENNVKDTLFLTADSLVLYTVRRCDITEEELTEREKNRDDILVDAIEEAEKKAAELRQKAYEEVMAKRPENIAKQTKLKNDAQKKVDSLAALGLAAPDSLYTLLGLDPAAEKSLLPPPSQSEALEDEVSKDSISAAGTEQISDLEPVSEPESLSGDKKESAETASEENMSKPQSAVVQDSTAAIPVVDTTKIRFIEGYRNVKMYRTDMQALCDSLAYSDLDSLARMYVEPVLWHKISSQLTSDVMILMMKNGQLYRGSMQQNAMIITQEDSVHYDQIKSTEMLGHFRNNELFRYDVLGGVNAMFYLKEDAAITTVNIKESQFMTVALKDGVAQRMKYYEQTKSDAYPIINLEKENQKIKGFVWRDDQRPKDRFYITDRTLYSSERQLYEGLEMPQYQFVNKYFDGYMSKVYLALVKKEEEKLQNKLRQDSTFCTSFEKLCTQSDSLFFKLLSDELDSLFVQNLAFVKQEKFRFNTPGNISTPSNCTQKVEALDENEIVIDNSEDSTTKSIEFTEPTKRQIRILKKAEKRILKSDKKFFRSLLKTIAKLKFV